MIKNIDGTALQPCSFQPVTGYQRKGYCYHSKEDAGKHLVCAKMDKRFLNYTRSKGNDLSGVVRQGDNWCVCEDRYYQAYKAGKAPKVLKAYRFYNVFPSNIAAIDLDYGSNDAVEEFTVELQVQYWTPTKVSE